MSDDHEKHLGAYVKFSISKKSKYLKIRERTISLKLIK